MAKNKFPLVPRFQCTIVCHQQTNIDGAREDWPDQNLGVFGQIIVIFAKIENLLVYIFSLLFEELS